MGCVTTARFNMAADILSSSSQTVPADESGVWETGQDPRTGEIIRTWVPNTEDPNTPEREATLNWFPCMARGIVDGGIRMVSNTERFSDIYDDVNIVRMTYPADHILTPRDRVTNIRGVNGNIIWREYHLPGSPPTVFSVNGCIPILDPFGYHIENFSLLERAEIQ